MSARSDRARAFGEEAATRLEAQLEELTTETAIRVQLGIAIADAYEKGAEIEERAGVEQVEGILAMARGTVTIDVSEIRRAYDMGVKAGAATTTTYQNIDRAEHEALRAFRMRGGERIIQLARTIGRHWREQDGVNGALLDELAELTTGGPPKVDSSRHRLIIWARAAGLLPVVTGENLVAVYVPDNCTVHTADAQAMALLIHSAFELAAATADGSRTMAMEIQSICEAVSLLRDRGATESPR